MLLASVSSSFTAQIAQHGVYAVFGLMAIDAVFPALSELVPTELVAWTSSW